jgi:CRISPR-associated protein (TIGR02710 family)
MNDKPVILFCTVGGSHEPIVTAVRSLRPAQVVFVCTGRDPGTGRAGSANQVLGQGKVIRAHRDDPAPTLPNIPTQAGLAEGSFEVLEVPADGLDDAFDLIQRCIEGMRGRFPEARLVADYTGGTKTMTAALVLAALEAGGIDLQLVTGNRPDLVRVLDGTERVALASVERIRVRRAMASALATWHRFAYDEAAEALETVQVPRDVHLAADLNRARDLSAALAAWDRFDHVEALRRLRPYAPIIGGRFGAHVGVLEALTDSDSPRREPLRIWDLWLNAERRARAGRYDDAVARLYRVIEWTAQWVLRARAGLDTADLPPDKVPEGLVAPSREGKLQAGLFAAWQLVQQHTGGAAARFFAERQNPLLDQLAVRNASILAHGFRPIGVPQRERMRSWAEEMFVPALAAEMKATHVATFPQLPDAYFG